MSIGGWWIVVAVAPALWPAAAAACPACRPLVRALIRDSAVSGRACFLLLPVVVLAGWGLFRARTVRNSGRTGRPDAVPEPARPGLLIASGILLGAGMGGFADGIILHQLLGLHHMISAVVPADTIVGLKANMFWDGVFHAGVWLLCAGGLGCLWVAGRRGTASWTGRVFTGALLEGWGLFQIVEGILNHHVLGLHHVSDVPSVAARWDPVYLAIGVVLLTTGRVLIGRGHPNARVGGSPA